MGHLCAPECSFLELSLSSHRQCSFGGHLAATIVFLWDYVCPEAVLVLGVGGRELEQ